MTKIYSAVKLPETAVKIIKDQNIELDMHDELTTPKPDEIAEKVKDADGLITGVNVQAPAEVIRANPDLKVIANVGSGFNNIDIEEADKHNIPVTNTPVHESVASTAELAFTLMLALSRRVLPGHEMAVKNEFDGWQVMGYLGGNQVIDKTLAVVGFGQIGQYIGKLALAFNMKLLYVDQEEKDTDLDAKKVSLEEALKEADYVITQVNYNETSHHLFGKKEFEQMKESAYFINTARGGVVDEAALADALKNNQIQAAALDVHEEEPHINETLAKLDNVILTPHIGNDTYEARNKMAEVAADQAVKALNKERLDYQVNK
ncbi:Putative 2-hydroxyacid dehydrogenase [Jeotgalicoccus saudimassiliensis]|uniref:Putative 2-hydroxyacid dehydrogenase n=1 Tax=Jeotgalicoccus saudimassiliensis TaxID=1461582 RepID=A0A078M9P8_9STAP|nr:D-glycerate dehydrogenase [Jeotgalicoccus saudimassiliensis]CEA02122.1 Putative 2-hydroxyacid dehydrogenase [Jeotgalicoccus saudimassiliensis]